MAVADKAVRSIGPYGDKEMYLTVMESFFESDFQGLNVQYKKRVSWTILPNVTMTVIPNFVIDDLVVELKVLEKIDQRAIWQVRRYMKALGKTVGILVNISGIEGKVQCYRVTPESCTLTTPA